MTITLSLQPKEEARLIAVAHARGLSTEGLLRAAIDRILADTADAPDFGETETATGADLIAAMQASPHKGIPLEPSRDRLPVRDIAF